jgi:hypothetical protein
MVENKIQICKQEVQTAQILSKNSTDGSMCTSCLQISIFSQICLGAFKIWARDFLDKYTLFPIMCHCQKHMLFVPDLLRDFSMSPIVLHLFHVSSKSLLGSYNDQDHPWTANISKHKYVLCKTRKPTFLVELANGQNDYPLMWVFFQASRK